MERKTADLHIHSRYSDSDLSVEQIFKQAEDAGLSCISITDHDTVDAINEAKEISLRYNVELLEGIELSSQKGDLEIHILGYLIDYKSSKLLDFLSGVRKFRQARLLDMMFRLNDLGMKIDQEDLLKYVGKAIPTRLHLALYMTKKGYISSIWEAFKKYLSYGKPAYVVRFPHSAEQAIRIIKDSGGLAFLAHPHFISKRGCIKELADAGLDGIEVMYPRYSRDDTARFSKLADSYNLLKSGGSDGHGSYKEFTSIGHIKIPYQWVEELKSAKR